MVGDLHERPDAVPAHPDRDVPAPVLDGVAGQVRHDPLQAPAVGDHHDLLGLDAHAVVPSPRADGGLHQRAQVEGLGPDRLAPGVEPGDLHEVLHQLAEAGHVGDQELGRPPGPLREVVEVLAQE